MNINSYNITDVTYHYIGLRVLAHLPPHTGRSSQVKEISRNVLKFVTDKALRLMLPQPSGTFEGTGEKICQELVHFQFARLHGGGYEVTEAGHSVLGLLTSQDFTVLRRLMAQVHLQTYDNLRLIVQSHIDAGKVWRPVVESARMSEKDYLKQLMVPTFGAEAETEADAIMAEYNGLSRGKVQDAMHGRIIQNLIPNQRIKVANFRAICDRLVSLRLLNQRRANWKGCEFTVSYSPCTADTPGRPWYVPLKISLGGSDSFHLFFCEPDMSDQHYQNILLGTVDEAFRNLSPEGGYYDIPDLRDWVCQHLIIPDEAFDDGINHLLDRQPPVLSAGLHYERITARRRPLVRRGPNVELHNLLRRL